MDTMINWYQMRGLGALAVFGLFLLYAALAGWRQGRKADGNAAGLTEQDAPSCAEPFEPNELDRRAA
jgi:hypothetical protein